MVKKYAVSTATGIITTLALCALFAVIASRSPDPARLYRPLGYAAYLCGCASCAIAAAKIIDNNALIGTTLSCGIYTLFTATLSLLFRDQNTAPFLTSLIFYLAGMIIALIIGLIFEKRGASPARSRKNMMKRMKKR